MEWKERGEEEGEVECYPLPLEILRYYRYRHSVIVLKYDKNITHPTKIYGSNYHLQLVRKTKHFVAFTKHFGTRNQRTFTKLIWLRLPSNYLQCIGYWHAQQCVHV